MDDDSPTTERGYERRGARRGTRRRRAASETRSLRRSVLLPFALGALLLGITVGTLAALATREAAHKELDDRAASVRNIVDDALEHRESNLREDARLLAERDLSGLGAGTYDPAGLRRLAAKDRIDRVTLTGPEGTRRIAGARVRWGRLPGAERRRLSGCIESKQGAAGEHEMRVELPVS